ncbi:erythromycin esterase family protein [Tunicatimonas pelagia]|uniref:erythromycin esterase family protein n=1 Tax=Tunicatimonas pelagia TaxID=931531 RepID=UPI002666007B|nr:erythromycin esterase family protein [Tunicatimonas pelagia]WKN41012.1 erythromycin esterase family protein [Tunicatimonas pelagia]
MTRHLSFHPCYCLYLLIVVLFSCRADDEVKLDPEVVSLLSSLEQEIVSLDNNPLVWGDDDLTFLDAVADKPIIGLGESTHGTAEFFNAKRRIFRYLVENHDYKVFAFEADFGESLFLEEAVQQGLKSQIRSLMSEKMHFWTWRTREVRNLLEWMSEYNVGKSEEDKVHYMGVDCQFNTYHPQLLNQYLQAADASFLELSGEVLSKVKADSEDRFEGYSSEDFTIYLGQIDALQDSMITHQDALIAATSEKEFELNLRLLRLTRQVSEVRYYRSIEDYSVNYRDKYMAENTAWMLDYFEGDKVVLWAHNAHIANDPNYGSGSIGHYLLQELPNDYSTVGFMFAQGSFTAVGFEGNQSTGLKEHTISEQPQEESLIEVFHNTNSSAFAVRMSDLQKYTEWNDFFNEGTRYLSIGSGFNDQPEDYYRSFHPSLYDQIIYFDNTTASQLF